MIDASEVERFIKDPSQLVDLCRDVIDQIDSGKENASDKEKEVQLLVIARSIEQLEKSGVPVPDALRGEKTRLAASLGVRNETKQVLDLLYEEFESITKDLKSRLQSYSTGGTSKQPGNSVTRSNTPKTPQRFYREYIIRSLKKHGDRARVADVLEDMGRQLNGVLIPGDFEIRKDGKTVGWHNTAQWERLVMVKEGILKSGSPSGIWELAEEQK